MPLEWGMDLATRVDELRAGGSRVETIFPDSNSEHMFGANAMDLALRPPLLTTKAEPLPSSSPNSRPAGSDPNNTLECEEPG